MGEFIYRSDVPPPQIPVPQGEPPRSEAVSTPNTRRWLRNRIFASGAALLTAGGILFVPTGNDKDDKPASSISAHFLPGTTVFVPKPEMPSPAPSKKKCKSDGSTAHLKPQTIVVRNWVKKNFGVCGDKIYGYAYRKKRSDHPYGLALDVMVYNDKALGDRIFEETIKNAKELRIKYVIWNNQIWEQPKGIYSYGPIARERYGSHATPRQLHKDHNHISVWP